MNVIIKGTLHRLIKKPDYKETVGKHALQLMIDSTMSNGQIKTDLKTITIPEDKVKQYSEKIGELVSVECGILGKDINFYGV